MTMNVMNKAAISVFPLPMTLLVVQMLIADVVLFAICGPRRLWNEIREHSDASARWSLLTFFFAGGLVTSIMALNYGSVILMLVSRNVMPLFSLIVERQLLRWAKHTWMINQCR